MSKIVINHSENSVSVKVGSLSNRFFKRGELLASAGTNQDEVTIQDSVNSIYICRDFPYSEIVDSSDSAWGATRTAAVQNLNDVINATPQTYIKSTDKITDLTGVESGDFLGTKPGYALFSGTTDGSIQTSDAIILGSGEIRLGAALDTNNFNITSNTNQNIKLVPGSGGKVRPHNAYNLPTSDGSNGQTIRTNGSGTLSFVDRFDVESNSLFTSTANGDVQITPNGTGSVNLDGTIKFKRFDSTLDPPDAFLGGMYADDADNLYFAVD